MIEKVHLLGQIQEKTNKPSPGPNPSIVLKPSEEQANKPSVGPKLSSEL